MHDDVVRLALTGDVMTGRGVDQVLPHPGDPTLRERYVEDARTYVDLAEKAGGDIPRPVEPTWPWGDALDVLDDAAPDVRVINLETSITTSDDFAPKGINYRMHPDNVGVLSVVAPDVCTLANNHVLDFGTAGLTETLEVLDAAGLGYAGAGRDAGEAQRPATVDLGRGGRVLVFSLGTISSGITPDWQATEDRPGVDVVHEPLAVQGTAVLDRIDRSRRDDDIVVVSIHWGSNWGYEVPEEQVRFAHALVDGGADVVHGHSSHHPRPVEIHRGRPILYGCGDFVNDYEGISGHEEFRDDLRLLYLLDLDVETRELAALRMVPLRARRMRLEHASEEDADWLRAVLSRTRATPGDEIDLRPNDDGALLLR